MPNLFTLPGKIYFIGVEAATDLSPYAMDLLRRSDVVFHDNSVSPEVLELVPAHTAVRAAGNHAGQSGVPENTSEEMIQAALHGQTVVRLGKGVPILDGKGGIAALREADVEFEIVPSVTAAATAG